MRLARSVAFASLLLGPLLLMRPAASQGLTPAQRAEVIGVLREALRSDPSILREAMLALQADDARREETAARDTIAKLAGRLVDPADPVAGNPLGDVTIVEFYDTRCPYCRRMLPTHAELLRADPNVRIVFKDLPILGPASQLESRALLAAQRQGGYFKLQQAVMHDTAPPTRDTLRSAAEKLGLDGGRLLRDMDDPAIKARLETNIALAQQIGIQGTPALIVGKKLFAGLIELGDLQQAVTAARTEN
jgi:protein-disulfide isomerase